MEIAFVIEDHLSLIVMVEQIAVVCDIFRSMICWSSSQGAKLAVSLAHLPRTVRLVIGQAEDTISILLTICAILLVLRPLSKTTSLSFSLMRHIQSNIGVQPVLLLAFSAHLYLCAPFAILTVEINHSYLLELLCALILASTATVETTRHISVSVQLIISTKILLTSSALPVRQSVWIVMGQLAWIASIAKRGTILHIKPRIAYYNVLLDSTKIT